MTTAIATASAVRPAVRSTGASFPTLVGLEIRKSLSTRSGKALAVAALLLAPAATTLASLSSTEPLGSAVGPIAVMGLLTSYVLVSLGVLSTAGEWSHGTVQTTFLLTPSRGRVLATKAVAVALLGAVFTAVAATLSAGVLSVLETGVSWDGAPRALIAVVAAGAALAVTGAGVGAALANTPGSLTGLYLVILGVMPVLENLKPALAEKIDPANAVLSLAQGQEQTTAIAVLGGWVLIASVAGWILTHRRAVQ
jgi:hypothetical protein